MQKLSLGFKNPTIQTDIENLVTKVTNESTGINQIKPPMPELSDSGKSWIERTGAIRGRPLLYPYMGSGRGQGPFVELVDGSIKLDFINGIGIHLLGHNHPRVLRASIEGALQDVVNQGNIQPNTEYTVFLENLVEIAKKGSRLKYAWLATCGTMANESAVKIARQKRSAARYIISFQNAFAGRSTLMAEVTDNPAYRVGLPEYNEVLRIPWYDKNDPLSTEKSLQALLEHINRHGTNICVFGFEPMLGEGGYQPAPKEFFIPLLETCKEHSIPIWADEVQTFTRTGEAFAFQTLGIGDYIDIVTIAKTAQVGATLYTEEMNPLPGLIAGTFSGTSTALRAGIEILDIMTENNYFGPQGKIQKIHSYFVNGLNQLAKTTCQGLIQDATGLGLMIAFTPLDGKKETVDKLLKVLFNKGLIAFSCGKSPVRVRFLVPAIVENHHIDLALKIIEESLLEGVT